MTMTINQFIRPTAAACAFAAVAAFASPAQAAKCTRLPLSDIAFGKPETIAQARGKLDDYAARVAAKRGWSGTRKSNETVSCKVFLNLGPIGTEYRCLVTATFCPK